MELSDTDYERSIPPDGADLYHRDEPLLAFEVRDTPAPQGSKNSRPVYRGRGEHRVFTGKVNTVESSKRVKPWREAVKEAAVEAMGKVPYSVPAVTGPVMVEVVFTVKRPESHWLPANSRRPEKVLRHDAPRWPIGGRGDLDKYQRSTLDALTAAGVWDNDGIVVRIVAEKTYPGTGDSLPVPGAIIRIWRQF